MSNIKIIWQNYFGSSTRARKSSTYMTQLFIIKTSFVIKVNEICGGGHFQVSGYQESMSQVLRVLASRFSVSKSRLQSSRVQFQGPWCQGPVSQGPRPLMKCPISLTFFKRILFSNLSSRVSSITVHCYGCLVHTRQTI